MTNFYSREKTGVANNREVQLRREIVAVMRLRALWRTAVRRQTVLDRPSAGDWHSATGSVPHYRLQHLASSGRDAGEHITRILLISDYDGLRSSCERLLHKHGYQVEAMSSYQCLGAIDLPGFDIAILCQSVERDRVPLLSRLLRHRNPGCCLLRVASLLSGIESGFDLRVDGFGGPAAFLAAIETLARRPLKSA